MKIKEFEALNLKECLQQVRAEMGPEAVILETRKFRKGGVMGLGARDAIKIVAATGVAVQEKADGGRRTGDGEFRVPSSEFRGTADGGRPTADNSDAKLKRLERELSELRSGVAAIQQAVVAAPAASAPRTAHSEPETCHYPELRQRLQNAEVSQDLADELLSALPDLSGWNAQARAPMAETALRDVMAGRVRGAGAIQLQAGQTRVIALIGPTGVGKTTTIAKLAANYALVEKKRVGLITMDTYRIAAVEQLKTYGQIIDIPIRVAYTPAEIAPALKYFAGYDVVLIDTAGRSQKNLMQVSELKSLIDAAGCETHLVLAASTKERDLLDQVARFRESRVDRLLFTKLDETTTYGTMFTVAAKTQLPVSYLTTGQKVPEDIEAADEARLVSLVMNG